MKSLSVVALSLAISLQLFSQSFIVKASAEGLKGDVNSDGTVNISDVIALSNFLYGKNDLSSLEVGDVNSDYVVEYSDMVAILSIIVGA